MIVSIIRATSQFVSDSELKTDFMEPLRPLCFLETTRILCILYQLHRRCVSIMMYSKYQIQRIGENTNKPGASQLQGQNALLITV